jgi:L-alanine-DL-glutamate epimerase-like enolase superfamily enzyme
VFSAHTEVGGNILQATLLEHALQEVGGHEFPDPTSILSHLLPRVHDYGVAVTRNPDLRPAFSLLSLVALDNAAWVLHARRAGIASFDDLIPREFRPYFSHRQKRLAIVPTIGYGFPEEELRRILENGVPLLKVKIGSAGTEDEMLRRDAEWMAQVHRIADACETPLTDCGKVLYYLDANGRYSQVDSVARLLDHARDIGMDRRIVIFEDPFDERLEIDVADLPARFAADEGLQTAADVEARVGQGYGAVALKPAGKTLSRTLEIVRAAHEAGVPCFVADNACVPVLVEWNKNVAARLPCFPGLKVGLLESNGPETYAGWTELLSACPVPNASWLRPEGGVCHLDNDYYRQSGGILLDPTPYCRLFR